MRHRSWLVDGKPWLLRFFDQVDFFPVSELDLPEHGRAIASHVAGNVWKVEVEEGATVKQGDPLVIVVSMKMEFTVPAPCDGRVYKIFCRPGGQVSAGQDLLVLIEDGRKVSAPSATG